jgi:hypothetical protein
MLRRFDWEVKMSLGKDKIVAFIPTKDAAVAREFYQERLGLASLSISQH